MTAHHIGDCSSGQAAGTRGAGPEMPAPRRSALVIRAREARREERMARRRGWDDLARLYAALADGLDALPR